MYGRSWTVPNSGIPSWCVSYKDMVTDGPYGRARSWRQHVQGRLRRGDSRVCYAMAGSFCFTLLRLGWRRDGLYDWKLLKNWGAMSDGVGWKEGWSTQHRADAQALEMLQQPFPVLTCVFWLGRSVLQLFLVFCRLCLKAAETFPLKWS